MVVFVCVVLVSCLFVFFFKQKTAYEMRISDWSSDVCSSDLALVRADGLAEGVAVLAVLHAVVEAGLDAADGKRRDGHPPLVEDLEELGEPAASLAEQVGCGHPAAGEGEPVRVGRVPAHLAVGERKSTRLNSSH